MVVDFDDPKLEALVETMFLAAFADGEFSEEEQAEFAKNVESLTDGRMSGDKFDAVFQRVKIDVDGEGRSERLAAIKDALPEPGQRRAALSLAIRVTASDGIIRTSERELILDIAEALDIPGDEAADLVRDLTK